MIRLCALALVLAACDSAPHGKPEDAIRDFFAGVEKRDCTVVMRSIAGELEGRIRKAGCEHALAEYHEHGLALLDVAVPRVDGRDRDARLVTVTVLKDGKTQQVVARVEPREGAWRLVVF